MTKTQLVQQSDNLKLSQLNECKNSALSAPTNQYVFENIRMIKFQESGVVDSGNRDKFAFIFIEKL